MIGEYGNEQQCIFNANVKESKYLSSAKELKYAPGSES